MTVEYAEVRTAAHCRRSLTALLPILEIDGLGNRRGKGEPTSHDRIEWKKKDYFLIKHFGTIPESTGRWREDGQAGQPTSWGRPMRSKEDSSGHIMGTGSNCTSLIHFSVLFEKLMLLLYSPVISWIEKSIQRRTFICTYIDVHGIYVPTYKSTKILL